MKNTGNKTDIFPLVLFFFSGFSALVYEVIWSRLLTLVFGTTVEAISAVITAYMFGLALGSYFAGKHSDFIRKHLTAYGITEILIGLSSLLLYYIIVAFPFFAKPFQGLRESHDVFFLLMTYAINFLLVVFPTTLMGATLPLMSKYFIRKTESIGYGVSLLYGVNTLGAVAGTFITGFYLIPTIGVWGTNLLAVFISISLGALGLIGGRRDRRSKIFDLTRIKKPLTGFIPAPGKTEKIILFVFLLSGFAAMAYEVVWTKLLVMVIGNSVYAFSAILTVYLAGIAIGSFMMTRFSDKIKKPFVFFAILEFAIFGYIAATLPFVDELPFVFQTLFNRYFTDFFSIEIITFFIVTIVVLVPTIFMGATFPLINRIIATRIGLLGISIGGSYSANTLGGIFGALFAGFYFIPFLGVEKSLLLILSVNLFAGIALISLSERVGNIFKTASILGAGMIFAVYAAWLPAWNVNYLNRGVYVYADWFRDNFKEAGVELKEFIDNKYKIKWYKEGRVGTVAVTDIGGQLGLQVNGKTEGSTGSVDMRTQMMVSALPLMIKGDTARDVAIVGLGTGITLGAAELFPVDNIDCIEISKDVIQAAHFFHEANHNALRNERLNMIMDDGRHYLTYTDKKYDVIVNEPSNPWITGVSNLFTQEFFEIAAKRLKKGGIMSQWVQLYSLDTKEVKILLKTFNSVFPYVSVWVYTASDLIVLGSMEDNVSDLNKIKEAFYNEGLYNDLKKIELDNISLVAAGLTMREDSIKKFTRNARINTDNFPIIEFQAPKRLFNPSPINNIRAIQNCCEG